MQTRANMQKQNRLLLIALLSTARAEREVLQGVCDEGQCKELSLLPGVWNLDRHDCNDAHLNDSYVSSQLFCLMREGVASREGVVSHYGYMYVHENEQQQR